MPELTIRPFRPEDRKAWQSHLATSNNGTLFHDLDFLAYHPVGRFDFHHLIVSCGERIEAVIPGAVRADGMFTSPSGASVGGPAIGRSLRLNDAMALIEQTQIYARARGWQGIEFTLPPPIYHDEPNQLIEFALHTGGFGLVEQALPLILPLHGPEPERYQQLFTQSKRSYVRANRRKGVSVRQAGPEGLKAFLALFDETYARHGQAATHTAAEIGDLFERLPDRVQIWLAWLDGIAIAGILLLALNQRVATTFYICDLTSHRDYHGLTVLMAHLADFLAERGFGYLDLGPSASSRHINRGALYFKESLGARGFCRGTWRWRAVDSGNRDR